MPNMLNLYTLTLKMIKFTVQDKMLCRLKTNEYYEFESREEYEKFSKNIILEGKSALRFLNNEEVLLRPEIEEKIKYIKSAISNAVEMAERYNDLETFDHDNGGKVEDMLMDIYHCFDVILHAFIE